MKFPPFRLILIAATVFFCFVPAARAATFTVTNLNDAGAGSLRQAVLDSETNAGADVINVAVTGTVLLTSSLPTINQSLTINGGGQTNLAVSGQNAVRVFLIGASGDLQLNGLTVRGGRTSGSGGNGGGIRNSGTLTINNSTITANTTDQNGGGIANFGTLTVTSSTVSNNSAFSAGGIYNVNTLTINNSTINNNAATTANGGGILNGGDVTINNSTISGNTCYLGCGIYNETGTLTLSNSTVVRNTNNVGVGAGGGIYNNNGIATVGNSIVAQNTGTNSRDVKGDFVSRGYNFIGRGDGSTGFGATGDLVGSENNPFSPGLTPLQDNGGATQTHAPSPGSPVIDKGKNLAVDANNNPITTDQRGLARTVDLDNNTYPNATGGDGTDIGAVEYQSAQNNAPVASASPNPATTNANTNVQITLTGTDADDNNLTFSITQQPANGALSAISTPDCSAVNVCTATVTYTPNQNYNGADSFQFKANDGAVDSNVVTVNITVAPRTAFTVNSLNDPGTGGCDQTECTLREAIAAAAPGNIIQFASPLFDSPQTINLAGEQPLFVNKNLTVNGRGANLLTVKQNVATRTAATRVFRIGDGSSSITVSLTGMTITGGDTDSQDDAGGGAGLRNEFGANTTLNGVHVTGNKSQRGLNAGGILNLGDLTLLGSAVTGNNVSIPGGSAGGIENRRNLAVINSTVSGNAADGSIRAIKLAGGIYNLGGSVTLANATVAANSAVADQSAARTAGGIVNEGGIVSVRNTIIAGNTIGFPQQPAASDLNNAFFNSQGYNLIGNVGAASGFTNGANNDKAGGANNQPILDARLDPLGFYGGATLTHRLKSDSPAINAGSDCVLTANGCGDGNPAVSTDQRGAGFARKSGASVDIGAFEFVTTPTAASVTIGGRIVDQNGRAVSKAIIIMTDANGNARYAVTNLFGFYRFADVAVGQTVVINLQHKRFVFAPRVLNVAEATDDLNFVAAP